MVAVAIAGDDEKWISGKQAVSNLFMVVKSMNILLNWIANNVKYLFISV